MGDHVDAPPNTRKGEARRHTPPPRHIGRLAWGRSGWCWWVKYRRLQISVLFWPR